MITPFAVASPHIGGRNYEQAEILKTILSYRGADSEQLRTPRGRPGPADRRG